MTRRWVQSIPYKPCWDWSRLERLLDWLGFNREIEYELTEDLGRATWEIPAWANSPGADVIGVWSPRRKRFTLGHIPLTVWSAVK